MKKIIKSILNLKDIETELLEDLLSANITDTEKEYIDYILKKIKLRMKKIKILKKYSIKLLKK